MATLLFRPIPFPKFVKSGKIQKPSIWEFFPKRRLLLYLYRAKRDLCNLYSLNGKTGLLFVQKVEAPKMFKKPLTKGFTDVILDTVAREDDAKTVKRKNQKSFEKRLTNKIQSAIIKARRTTLDVKKYVPNEKGDLL